MKGNGILTQDNQSMLPPAIILATPNQSHQAMYVYLIQCCKKRYEKKGKKKKNIYVNDHTVELIIS